MLTHLLEEVLARREELRSYWKSIYELKPVIESTPKSVSAKYGLVTKAEVVLLISSQVKIQHNEVTIVTKVILCYSSTSILFLVLYDIILPGTGIVDSRICKQKLNRL